MDAGAANVIVQGYLKGAFDVLEALLGSPFMYDAEETGDLDADALGSLMDELSVCLRGDIAGGGAVALLLRNADAAKLLALMEGSETEPKASLDDSDMATLKEIGDSILGGGISNLAEKFGEDLEIENIEVVVSDPSGAEALLAQLEAATQSRFRYQADPIMPESPAVLLFSHSLESRVPNELVDSVFGDGDEGGTEQLVSDDEIQDILSGFDPGAEGGDGGPGGLSAPENLDIILDIELVATVRLGVVEMPLSDVLNLGPGSVVDVGQLVDDPVELLVNGRLVARGDVVVVDEKFGLRITEIVSRRERIESLR